MKDSRSGNHNLLISIHALEYIDVSEQNEWVELLFCDHMRCLMMHANLL